MQNALEFRDAHYLNECLLDQDCFATTLEIQRCIGLNKRTGYPGEQAEVIRKSIFIHAEIKAIPLGVIEEAGGTLVVGDLEFRSPIEIQGSQEKEGYNPLGDNIDPDLVADIIVVKGTPYQGRWFAIGVPEPGQVIEGQKALFWNVNIRRLKGHARGK